VVHVTIDPEVPPTTTRATAEDDEGGDVSETDPDKIITNARPATPLDGLLTTTELIELYATPVRSAYDEGLSKHRESENDVVTYRDRVSFQASRRGANEPEWTSYTHYWKTVLGTLHNYSTRLLPADRPQTTSSSWTHPTANQLSLGFLNHFGRKILTLVSPVKASAVAIMFH